MAMQIAGDETITLIYPITVNGRAINEVVMRRPKLRDLKLAQKYKDDFDKSTFLIGSLCELTPDEVMELDAADFRVMSKRLGEQAEELED